jgi:hypothetical protein
MPTLGNTPRPAYVYDTETDTWVPVGVGAHTHSDIPNTLVDAKGDIITATADNVPARLAKGADGTILVSDSSTSTGLAWQPYGAIQVAGKNKIINGDFSVWQRATSIASATAGAYTTVDRFKFWPTLGTTMAVSRQSFTPGASGISGYEPQYYIRNVVVSGNAAGTTGTMVQHVEDVRTLDGQQFTFSFWAKADSTKRIGAEIVQVFGTGGSSSASTPLGYQTITSSWQRFTFTGILPSISGKTITSDSSLEVTIWMDAGSSYNARSSSMGNQSGTFEIWGIQLEKGPIATPFTTATGTIQGELAACQRYYYKFGTEGSSSSFFFSPLGMANATTQVIVTVPFPQVMRAKPSSIDYLAPRVWDGVNTAVVASSLTFGDASTTSGSINANGSGFTLYRPYWLMNNSGSYIGFNAEL